MPVDFSADDVLEMAEQIERNGARFYRKAADGADQDVKPLLLKLAAMEDQHEITFKAMRAELPESARQPVVFDPEGEGQAYLQAMADGHVFDIREDPAAGLTGDERALDVLEVALDREKEAVVFFTALKQMTPDDVGKDKVQAIIEEELDHIGMISRQIATRK